MKKIFFVTLLMSLFTLFIFSCGQNAQPTTSESSDLEEVSLEKEFGGYNTEDEMAAFGSAELMAETMEGDDAGDHFANEVEVMDMIHGNGDQSHKKIYFVRIIFGQMEGDSSATEVTDWSGSASVDKGSLVVLKTIDFESDDTLELPRSDRRVVRFKSSTKSFYDGLLFAVISNNPKERDHTFSFHAGAFSTTLTFSQLDSLELLEPVGASGNEISIISRSGSFAKGGFIAGRWHKTDDNGGRFQGRWMNSAGINQGHIKGIWGVDQLDRKVFKGKYITSNGRFAGFIAGEWEYESAGKNGSFKGRFVNENHETVGVVHGKFKSGRESSRGGFFQARYRSID